MSLYFTIQIPVFASLVYYLELNILNFLKDEILC